MAVTISKEDVKFSSGHGPIHCPNYNLYRYIESKNFAEAGRLIEECSQIDKMKKSDHRSFVSLVLKYYILTNNSEVNSFYHTNKKNLMKNGGKYG